MERLSIAGPSSGSYSGIFLEARRIDTNGSSSAFGNSDGLDEVSTRTNGLCGVKSKSVGFGMESGFWGPRVSASQGHGQWPLGCGASDRVIRPGRQ